MATNKTFEELLEDAAIRQWIYANQHQNEAFWEQWAKEKSIAPAVLRQVQSFLLQIQGKAITLDENYIHQQVEEALRKAKEQEALAEEIIKYSYPLFRWKYWAIAASLLLLVGLTWYLFSLREETVPLASAQKHLATIHQQEEPITVYNANEQNKLVVLPDGSTVILQKGSQLQYYASFNAQQRDVSLSGEAFFEVTKDAQKPFVVFTKDLVTKVLGTSFTIKAFDDAPEVQVLVRTGKVAVIAKPSLKDLEALKDNTLKGLVLHAKENISYQRNDNTLSKIILNKPQFLPQNTTDETFSFKRTPIPQALEQLEEAYGIDIVFDATLLQKCTITATLGTEPLNEKIKWICSAIDASYTVSDGKIIIEGKPCTE